MILLTTVIFPIFGLIFLGFLATKFRYLSSETSDALSEFVFRLALPVMVFRTVAITEVGGDIPYTLWAAYGIAILINWGLATLLIRRIFRREPRAGAVAGISASFANLVLIGVPVISTAYGDEGMIPHLYLVTVHLPFMLALGTITMDLAARREGLEDLTRGRLDMARSIFFGLLKNPIILAIFAGTLWRLSGFTMPPPVGELLKMLAQAAVPLALFSVGAGLMKYWANRSVTPAICLALLKTILFPALVYGLSVHVFTVPPLWQAVAVTAAACPTGVNAYLLAAHYKTGHALAANTMTLSTAFSAFSLIFWLTVAKSLLT